VRDYLSETGRYAFVQQGSFSHVNSYLRAALDEQLSSVASYLIDVREPRRLTRRTILNVPFASIPTAVRELGPLALSSPRAALGRRYFTTYMFDHRSNVGRMCAESIAPRFVFQTQTLFDASLDTCPFYIYTDHTVLANRRYPTQPDQVSWPSGWLKRERAAYHAAARIFVTSDFARRSLVEDYDYPDDRITVAHSGVNLAAMPAVGVRDRPVRTILFAGREWDRKGGPVLLDAFRAVRRDVAELRLVVVGCRPSVREPGLMVVGPVTPSDMDGWFRQADVFCMPSWWEPSAVVYTEAGAYRLPVIGTRVGGTPERVLHERTGYLCDPGDSSAVASYLKELITTPGVAQRMGDAGRQLVERQFTWGHVAAKIAPQLECLA
jgi:glycosyltransferase involved in cell wall biosynthesis